MDATVEPMLASLGRALPAGGGWCYEPKWDGFRCLALRDGRHTALVSRNGRPLGRYFPEVVEGLLDLGDQPFVLDGEVVVVGEDGLDFAALMLRLHPSPSRVARLRAETPATFVAFDLLALGPDDLAPAPLTDRRAALAALVGGHLPPVVLTPATDDRDLAGQWLERFTGEGIDGVVAKRADSRYEPGRRSRSWVKVKPHRTADCVVGGMRLVLGERQVASLLLGVYDDEGQLRHSGVASSFPAARRRQLVDELRPHVMALAGHPWERGFALERGPAGRLAGAAGSWDPAAMIQDWVPLRPATVCEVEYDQVDRNGRWRHPARFLRWRPDRDPRSCTLDQFRVAPAPAGAVSGLLRPS